MGNFTQNFLLILHADGAGARPPQYAFASQRIAIAHSELIIVVTCSILSSL